MAHLIPLKKYFPVATGDMLCSGLRTRTALLIYLLGFFGRRSQTKLIIQPSTLFENTAVLKLLKGDQIKIGPADRTPRETLEERLEETPSNAR
jgi:hypothetical protein